MPEACFLVCCLSICFPLLCWIDLERKKRKENQRWFFCFPFAVNFSHRSSSSSIAEQRKGKTNIYVLMDYGRLLKASSTLPYYAGEIKKKTSFISTVSCHTWEDICGRRSGLMVSALDSGASALGSIPGWGHFLVFLGKTLYSHGASLHPGV